MKTQPRKKIVIEIYDIENGSEEKVVRVYQYGKQVKTVLTTRVIINTKEDK